MNNIFLILIIVILIIFIIAEARFFIKKIYEYKLLINLKDKSTLKKQNSVIKGLISEQWAPILPNFPCPAEDVFHYGGIIDFLGFEGYNKGHIKKIWFIDSKYNKGKLSFKQKNIQEIIEKLNNKDLIEFRIYNLKNESK